MLSPSEYRHRGGLLCGGLGWGGEAITPQVTGLAEGGEAAYDRCVEGGAVTLRQTQQSPDLIYI